MEKNLESKGLLHEMSLIENYKPTESKLTIEMVDIFFKQVKDRQPNTPSKPQMFASIFMIKDCWINICKEDKKAFIAFLNNIDIVTGIEGYNYIESLKLNELT